MKRESKNWIDLESLLSEGNSIQVKPRGYSMYPLFRPGRDEAIISPVTRQLHRGDVVLYQRMEGILILHRIWKIDKTGYYMVGDNQSLIEGPLQENQIKGILTEVIHDGTRFSVDKPGYRLVAEIWLRLCPVRPYILKMVSAIRRKRNHNSWKKNSDISWRDE